MWLLNQWGFTDSCENKHDPTVVLVRAWDLESLEYLCDYAGIERSRIFTDMPSDIPFRCEMAREEYATACYNAAMDVDYPKFKPAVADNRGAAYNSLVHRWWGDFRSLLLTPEVRQANTDAWDAYAAEHRNDADRSWMKRNIDSPMPEWAMDPKDEAGQSGLFSYPELDDDLAAEVADAIAYTPDELDVSDMTEKEYEAYCDARALDFT